ncbi:MAG: phosphatase PAP2 family protein [Proteobacteria bacterium]|nr:phosphatase PAP2 family protein [Pseudomonadota bacterium]MBI3497939.1 phosphatase PAP2 family protein [Pseudomonadota bacterium]
MIDAIAELGSPGLCVTTVLLFAAWMQGVGLSRTVQGFVLGVSAVAAATLMLKWLVATPDDALWPDSALTSQYFPSGHAALAAALYGSVATALARTGGGAWRYMPFGALALASAVALARVAVRAHPAGDAVAGLIIGMIAPASTYFGMVREAKAFPGASRIFGAFIVALLFGWLLPAPVVALLPF